MNISEKIAVTVVKHILRENCVHTYVCMCVKDNSPTYCWGLYLSHIGLVTALRHDLGLWQHGDTISSKFATNRSDFAVISLSAFSTILHLS